MCVKLDLTDKRNKADGLVQESTKAPAAAGEIHGDFEKGFVMAEVMHFADLKEAGTEVRCAAVLRVCVCMCGECADVGAGCRVR
jgi:ribosome-binding ATPase YchF (GTP1/OBG family)